MPRVMKCPNCGAEFEVPQTVSIAVCPYCGTTVWTATGEVYREHYMFELRVEPNRAFDAVRSIAQRQFAAPEDVASEASPRDFYLHFIPLYLYHVRVRAVCPGNPEAGHEEEYRSLPALEPLPRGVPQGYLFPTRGRVYFKPSLLRRGRYHQPNLDPEKLKAVASARAAARAREEALNECDAPQLVDETRWLGVVHYPFWEVTYAYSGREYKAVVDGTDASVVYMEYPIGGKERGLLLALGLGGMAAAALLGLALGAHLGHPAAGAAGGAGSAVPAAAVGLRMGTARRGIYKLKARIARRRR